MVVGEGINRTHTRTRQSHADHKVLDPVLAKEDGLREAHGNSQLKYLECRGEIKRKMDWLNFKGSEPYNHLTEFWLLTNEIEKSSLSIDGEV